MRIKLYVGFFVFIFTLSTFINSPATLASVPSDGAYVCGTRTYSIVGGIVTNGRSCDGVVVIPDGVTSIGPAAFYKASELTAITFPNSLKSIEGSAFAGTTSLTTVNFVNGSRLASIGEFAFEGSSIKNISIPSGLTSIDRNAFAGARSLTSFTIPNGVTSIGAAAFYGTTSLTKIEIPEGVNSIGAFAFFEATSLQSVRLPRSVRTIGDNAFRRTLSLSNITIPEGVLSIGSGAFSGATALTNITIPKGVTSIGEVAFAESTSLRIIRFLGNAPSSFPRFGAGQAADAKAIISPGATGFNLERDGKWNGLILETATAKLLADEIAAPQIVQLINELPNIDAININDAAAITSARVGLDALGANAQLLVSNILTLELAEKKLLSIQKSAAEIIAKQEAEAKAAAELKAKQEAEAKAAAELKAKQEAEAKAKAAATKKTTITCVKGKITKKVTAVKPKCPVGYKVKK
jgi:hypothetical protein